MKFLKIAKNYILYSLDEVNESVLKNTEFIEFTKGRVLTDESKCFYEGELYLSSYVNGVVEYSKGDRGYILSLHHAQKYLGQIEYFAVPTGETEEISE